jgi:hypothetical protein
LEERRKKIEDEKRKMEVNKLDEKIGVYEKKITSVMIKKMKVFKI